MEIYLFGASLLGQNAFQNLKYKYSVCGFIDNDSSKWGKKINDINIVSLRDVEEYRNIKIIITSAYYLDIVKQLKDLGFSDIEIYFPSKRLESYYLEKIEEIDINTRTTGTILLIISFYSVYIQEYMIKLYDKFGIKVDILTRDKEYKEKINSSYINNIYYYNNYEYAIKVIEYNKYDFIHVHYMEQVYCNFEKVIKDNCKKLIITYWGSDYYRQTKNDRILEKSMLNSADVITFDNTEMLNAFCKELGKKIYRKCIIRRFGLTSLEYLKKMNINIEEIKKEKKIPSNKVVIMCGYNGKREQQQIEMIKSILKLPSKKKDTIYLVIPMTYGVYDYKDIHKIKELLKDSTIEYTILEEFMNLNDMAMYTKIVDIMIHLQTTDTLSATMLEQLFDGNIVINGAWLPYDDLKNRGIYFNTVSDINKLSCELERILDNLNEERNKFTKNSDKIYELSSWEANCSKWMELYI